MSDKTKMVHRERDIVAAWRSLTSDAPMPDDLLDFVRDVDTVVRYLGGTEAALRSQQVVALAIVLRWREMSRQPSSGGESK